MKHPSDHIRQPSRRYFPLQLLPGPARASVRQGLASTSGWASRKPIQEVLMKSCSSCFSARPRSAPPVSPQFYLLAEASDFSSR
jgi:hypothetical protein